MGPCRGGWSTTYYRSLKKGPDPGSNTNYNGYYGCVGVKVPAKAYGPVAQLGRALDFYVKYVSSISIIVDRSYQVVAGSNPVRPVHLYLEVELSMQKRWAYGYLERCVEVNAGNT